VRIHRDSKDIVAFSVGNMDGLGNYGGDPQVRFRNLRFTRL
jgi:hypothetical protein